MDQYAGTPALTIYDSGGSDALLDCSGYSVNQIIDLNPGHWSSLGGAVNNIGIYLTTNIENAIGGTGDDVFISNGSLIGTLTGGGGNDTFKATQAGLNLYTISGLSFGDKINFTDASFASFNYTFDGTALRYEGNTIWVSNNPHGAFQVSADTISEVDLTLIPLPPPDLNKVVGPQIMFALTGHTETSEAQFNFHAQYVPQTVSFYANVVHSADPGLGPLRISWLVPLVGYRVPKQFC